MRVISGFLKGRRIKTMKGFNSRPTTDFAKEGLFNVLNHLYDIEDSVVLDIFSGTGNMSYEFISRGANLVYSVDSNYKAYQFVKITSKELDLTDESHRVIKYDALKFLHKTENKFDFIFADPPFEYNEYENIVNETKERALLNRNGILIIEHSKKIELIDLIGYQKTHLFGNVCFSFFNFG